VLPALRLRPPVWRSRASFPGASGVHGYLQRTGHPPRFRAASSGYRLLDVAEACIGSAPRHAPPGRQEWTWTRWPRFH